MEKETATGTEEVTTNENLNSDDAPAADFHEGIEFEDSWTDPAVETETPPAADETNTDKTAEKEEGAATSDNTDGESGKEDTGDNPPAEPKKKKAQERIDELTRKRRDAERDAEYWRAVAEGKIKPPEKSAEQPQQKTESGSPERPREEDFETYQEYEDAFVDYRIDQREAAAKAKTAENEQQTAQTEFNDKVAATLTAGAEKYADFDEVVQNPDLKMNGAMVEAAIEGEHAVDVLRHLGKNPEESARIAGLSPIAAAREIGKIEAGIVAKANVKPPEPKKITKAPEPIKPIGGGKTPVKKDPNKMSINEYAAARDKGEI